MSRQEKSYGNLSGSYVAAATEEPVEESFAIPMALDTPGNTFTGGYLAVAHVYGRHRNASAGSGRVLVNLGTNGVSDDGSAVPTIASSSSWVIFEKTVVGQSATVDPESWSLVIGATEGEIEVLNASLVVVAL